RGRCPRSHGAAGAGEAPRPNARGDDPVGPPDLPGRPTGLRDLPSVRALSNRPAGSREAVAMMPLPQLIAELMLGIGVALFGANFLVAIRAHLSGSKPARGAGGRSRAKKPSPGRPTAPT